MTLKTSLNKTVLNLFTFTLKKNLGFSLIATILAVVLSPVYLYSIITDYIESYDKLIYNFEDLFMTFSVLMAVAAMAFLMVLLYINFSYLYKKSASDFFHALPIKRSALLGVRFLGSFTAALIPLTSGYIGAFALTFLDYVSADRGIIIQAYFFTVGMMLMLGLFTLLFIVTAGGVFDSIIALLAVNIGIPVIALFVAGLCSDKLYGFYYGGDMEVNILSGTTPFGYAIIRLINALYGEADTVLFTWGRVLGTVAAIIALALVNVFCYNCRKSEKVEGSYAFKIIPEIIGVIVAALGLFVMAYIFSDDSDNVSFWLAGVIGAAIASVVYFLIINRGFKRLKTSLVVALVAFAGLLITNLGIAFDIFGWEYALPKADEIASVTISNYTTTIDVKNIDLAVELNNEIVKGHNNKEYTEKYVTDNYEFEYTLKNGKTVNRNYSVEMPVAEAQRLRLINEELPRQILEDYDEIKKLNCKDWSINGYLYDTDANYIGDFNATESAETAEKLVTAYIEDLKTIGTEYFGSKRSGNTCVSINGRVVINETSEIQEDGTVRYYHDYQEFNIWVRNIDDYPKFKEVYNTLEFEINYAENEKYID